jgi:hypothetical protein
MTVLADWWFKLQVHTTVYVHNYRYTLQCMYTITHIPLSVQTKELYDAMQINQSHTITKQYQTTVHFHLNLTNNIQSVHKSHYMILRSMITELPCSRSNNINHYNYHTGSLRWHLKNLKFSLLLFVLYLTVTNSLFIKQSGKYFKLFINSGLEKIVQSRDFGMIIITEHNITYRTATFPELVDANRLNIQHSMQGWQVHCDV